MQSGISRRTTTSTTNGFTSSNTVNRSRPSALIPSSGKVNITTSKASDDKKMTVNLKQSTIRRPASRETLANPNKLSNGTCNEASRETSYAKEIVRPNKLDISSATTRQPKPLIQMQFNGNNNNNNTTIKRAATKSATSNGFAKDTPSGNKTLINRRNEINSTRKSTVPGSNTTNGPTSNGVASKKPAGTASARAATTLISLQKDIDKYRKLSELYKKQLDATKVDMSKSMLVVDGLSVVVRYLNEHLNAFTTPSLHAEIKRGQQYYNELKDDYSNLEQVMAEMKAEHDKREEDLKDEIERMSIEMVNEKKRHSNEKNRLFDMFEDQMEAQKKEFKKEMEQAEKEKVDLEKIIERLNIEIKEKISEIEKLTHRIGDLESSLSMEKDRRCRMLQEKVKFMTNEIQSLKDVLDLKDSELRTIKTSIANEELLRQDLAIAQQSIANLQQRFEQLEISANQKNAMINMLKEENESLRERYDKEQRERRRISMKNEELEYTLSEIVTPRKGDSLDVSLTDSDLFLTPMQPPPRSRLTMASVPPSRPHSSGSIRSKVRASFSVQRPNHHYHSDCLKPLTKPLSSSSLKPISSSSTSTESTESTSCSRSSASIKLTFQEAIINEDGDCVTSTHSNDNSGDDTIGEDDNNNTTTTPTTPTTVRIFNKDSSDSTDTTPIATTPNAGRDSANGFNNTTPIALNDTSDSNGANTTFFVADDNNATHKPHLPIDRAESSGASSANSTSSLPDTRNCLRGQAAGKVNANSFSVNSGACSRSETSDEDESDAPKSLPSYLPQSILDSGFEDIEGLIAFR